MFPRYITDPTLLTLSNILRSTLFEVKRTWLEVFSTRCSGCRVNRRGLLSNPNGVKGHLRIEANTSANYQFLFHDLAVSPLHFRM